MLRISSFNIQNDFSKYNINKSKEIYNYLVQNKINILGLQEVYSKINKDLINLLPSKYTYNGNYRFFSKIILNRINEKTPIITDKKIKFSKTYNLPHLPSLLKRVVVKNVINYKGYDISIYNTHLDFMFESVKLRELKYLYKLISKDNNLVGKMVTQGTTPRRITDLVGSLADLTSGSGDKGTPVVLIQGYFDNYANE